MVFAFSGNTRRYATRTKVPRFARDDKHDAVQQLLQVRIMLESYSAGDFLSCPMQTSARRPKTTTMLRLI